MLVIKTFHLSILVFCLALFRTVSFSQGKSTSSKPLSIQQADTLFFNGRWEQARAAYEANSKGHPENIKAVTWNRLGYCYHNLGNYATALKYYSKAIELKPPLPMKPVLTSRMARAYARMNENNKALAWLDTAVASGYAGLLEMDTLTDYNSIRKSEKFKSFRDKVYATVYPCSANPENREFDFWMGEWDVYRTGTTSPKVGHSLIQNGSGGCMIIENWTSLTSAHEGKSINYYDPAMKYWEQDWLGSDGTPVHFINGEYKDAAMHFTFDSVQPDGSKWPGRFIFYNQGPNQVRQYSEHSPDGGKTWVVNYDFTYVRVVGH